MMRIKNPFSKASTSRRAATETWGSSTYSIDEDGEDSDSEASEIAIAVMGATGSGKSTFINLISESGIPVNHSLRTPTIDPELSKVFHIDGRRVYLVDIPGFGDATRSDVDVFQSIAAFLATSYGFGCKLAGVLYLHRITDVRMGGVAVRNARIFLKLCGDYALKNVIIVTNMWEQVHPHIGLARETELMRGDPFFKPALDKGAKMVRHENTAASAEAILRLALDNQPLPLRIQKELVEENKEIVETDAGKELGQGFNGAQHAIREKDEQMRRELQAEMNNVRKRMRGWK